MCVNMKCYLLFICCLYTSCSLARSRAFSSYLSRSLAVNRRHWKQKKEKKEEKNRGVILFRLSYLITDHSTHFTEWNARIILDQSFS